MDTNIINFIRSNMDNKNNVWFVKSLKDLKTILQSNMTVILGICLKDSKKEEKYMIKKFLKSKSKSYPLITFVYMEISEELLGVLNLFSENISSYPLFYHIRDGKDIIICIEETTNEALHNSFEDVEKFYNEEMVKIYGKIKESIQQKQSKSKMKINLDTLIENDNDEIDNNEVDNNNNNNDDNNDDDDNNDNNDNNNDENNKNIKKPTSKNIKKNGKNINEKLSTKQKELMKKKNPEKLLTYAKLCEKKKLNYISEIQKRRNIEENLEESDEESEDSEDIRRKKLSRRNMRI